MQSFRTISFFVLMTMSALISVYLAIFAEITAFNLFIAFPILFLIVFAGCGYWIEAKKGFIESTPKKNNIEAFEENSLTQNMSKCSFRKNLKIGPDKVA